MTIDTAEDATLPEDTKKPRWGSFQQWVVGVLGFLFMLLWIVPFVSGFFGSSDPAPPFGVGQGQVQSRDIALDLRSDGSMRVTETEVIKFPSGSASNSHGITRIISLGERFGAGAGKAPRFPLSDLKVTSPSGAPTQVQRQSEGDRVALRIGDPKSIVTGKQTYVISYTLRSVVQHPDKDFGEAYFAWDVLKSENPQRIGAMSVSVKAPVSALQAQCHYGNNPDNVTCKRLPGNGLRWAIPAISPGEGVTVLATFPAAAFTALDRTTVLTWVIIGASAAAPFVTGFVMWLRNRKRRGDEHYAGLTPGLTPGANDSVRITRGREREGAVQFTPPAGVHPGLVGTILDKSADSRDVSAALIDLGMRGYLTIGNTAHFQQSEWTLTRTNDADLSRLGPDEKVILEQVFAKVPVVDGVQTTTLQNLSMGTSAMEQIKGTMSQEVVRRGWFRQRPDREKAAAFPRSAWVLWGLGILILIALLGWPPLNTGLGPVPVGLFPVVGMLLASLVVAVGSELHIPRTAEGSAVMSQSLGFKRYLMTAEANQIKFEEAQSLFSRYLPYAIVFGVQSQWAATFDQVALQAQAEGISLPPPVGWAFHAGVDVSFAHIAELIDSFSSLTANAVWGLPLDSDFDQGWLGLAGDFLSDWDFSIGGGGGGIGGSW